MWPSWLEKLCKKTRSNILVTQKTQNNFVTFVPLCGYSLWPQREFLHSPVQRLGDVDFILAVAIHGMDRAEFFEEFARSAEFTDDLSVEGQLVDFPIVQRRAGIRV